MDSISRDSTNLFNCVSLSAVEPSKDAEDREASTGDVVSNNKSSTIYATAPRSKVSRAVFIVDLFSQEVII